MILLWLRIYLTREILWVWCEKISFSVGYLMYKLCLYVYNSLKYLFQFLWYFQLVYFQNICMMTSIIFVNNIPVKLAVQKNWIMIEELCIEGFAVLIRWHSIHVLTLSLRLGYRMWKILIYLLGFYQLKLPWVPCLCRDSSKRYRRERTGRVIFVPRGELLCKAEYASWHLKYACPKDRKAKYTYYISDWSVFIITCRKAWT